MKLKDWLKQFDNYSKDMLEKDIVIQCPNGLIVEPKVKRYLKDEMDVLNQGLDNIKSFVITY